MAKYGEGFSFEFAKAVKQGMIQRPFSTENVKRFAEMKGWEPSQKYLNVVLPNGSSLTHSLTYKKYFKRVGEGLYELSDEGENVPVD